MNEKRSSTQKCDSSESFPKTIIAATIKCEFGDGSCALYEINGALPNALRIVQETTNDYVLKDPNVIAGNRSPEKIEFVGFLRNCAEIEAEERKYTIVSTKR